MKAIQITCTLLFAATLVSAQTEKKTATVRIRTVENINGVEKVRDTTYTTDNLSGTEAPATIIMEKGDKLKLEIPEGGERRIRTIEITGDERKELSAEDEKRIQKALKDAGVKGEVRSLQEPLIIINSEEDGTAGKTVMIKRPKNGCNASKEEIDNTEVYRTVVIVRKADLSELNEADRKALYGKSGSIAKPLTVEGLKFYPNPTNGKFNLSFDLQQKGDTEVSIRAMDGKVVYKEDLPAFSGKYDKEIDLSKCPGGTYLVKITQGNHAQVKKLVLE